MQLVSILKNKAKSFIASTAINIFHFECNPFPTIISNDCFGGEIYRSLGVKYNTPFVGLMLMAPCYLKLLKNLTFYMDQELKFKENSIYPSVNELLNKRGYFPVGSLNDEIEIQFLHYKSEEEAFRKWEVRKKRMDMHNLFVKFDYSKDYSNDELLREFLKLKYKCKLAIGSSKEYGDVARCDLINLPEYSSDGAVLFRLSLRYIDYRRLLEHNVLAKPAPAKGLITSKFLRNSWIDRNKKI